MLSRLRRQEQNEKFQQEFLLKKMEQGQELSMHEQDLANKLMSIQLQGEYMLEGKMLDAKNKPKPAPAK
jgi:hypothetical protein